MATAKNAVKEAEVVDDTAGLPANPFADFSEEQVGFAPYIKAEVGKGFYARVITADTRDPDFIRFVLEYLGMPSSFDTKLMQSGKVTLDTKSTLLCKRGPKDDAEHVAVKVGEFFTISNYAGLPLEIYIDEPVFVDCTGMRETKQPNDMFVFRISTNEATKRRLAGQRRQEMASLRAARNRPQLQA